MTPEELADLRDRLSRMSVTALLDQYHSAWYELPTRKPRGAQRGSNSEAGTGVEELKGLKR